MSTTRSNVDISLSLALRDASRNLATFSRGVSPGGAGGANARYAADLDDLEFAYGPVAVKRVASTADRGMV